MIIDHLSPWFPLEGTTAVFGCHLIICGDTSTFSITVETREHEDENGNLETMEGGDTMTASRGESRPARSQSSPQGFFEHVRLKCEVTSINKTGWVTFRMLDTTSDTD